MLDEPLRRRLEALNREPLPGSGGSAVAEVSLGGWGRSNAEPPARRGVPPVGSLPGTLASLGAACISAAGTGPQVGNLLECGEVVDTPAGTHLRIVQSVETLWDRGERLVAARHGILKHAFAENGHTSGPASPEQAIEDCSYRSEARALVASFPDRAVFLDLETCGLAGAALFLVGLLRRIDRRLVVELLLARTYAEEKAVLVSLWERMASHDVLVTFNGKSFDWPMVHDRSTRYLLSRAAPPPVHVDILHHARRRWRGRLPNCKLQTLERYICGRRREGDIPGVQIPAAYQRFVNTGERREMASILLHNALDLVTLLDLSLRLADA